MLELKNITKIIKQKNNNLKILRDINIKFRKKELVSILGESGSGKTTLLNIIGGLDKQTFGDLIINGKSNIYFKEKEFDSYRNKKIGIVFQNYNLIENLNVLDNILIKSRMNNLNKKVYKNKAIYLLEKLNLKNKIYSNINTLSGGEKQRVAIARALINDPEIILADEPTGALDSETSIQIMNLLKEIAKEKLVILVTHNIILASQYSDRIIILKDGTIVSDSKPLLEEENIKENKYIKNKSISIIQSIKLSLLSMKTKKFRTILIGATGAIGITGIVLIIALTTSVKNYFNEIENKTLYNYPIEIKESNLNELDMLLDTDITYKENKDKKIKSTNELYSLNKSINSNIKTNDLKYIKTYLEENKFDNTIIQYEYNIDLNIYNKDKLIKKDLLKESNLKYYNEYINTNIFTELLQKDILEEEYDLINGTYPKNKNELVLILNKDYTIDEYTLYALELIKDFNKKDLVFEYNDFYNLELKLLLNKDKYYKESNVYKEKENYDKFEELRIVGIIKSKNTNIMNGSIGYTKDLIEYINYETINSKIYRDQLEKDNIDIFTNKSFTQLESNLEKIGFINLDKPSIIKLYSKKFEDKNKLIQILDEHNKNSKENKIINYEDTYSNMINSLEKVVDIISITLILLVSISLLVSTIMISIVIYISVQEREKEIGILRSLGASKKDIKRLIMSETIIIGFISGVIGILNSKLLFNVVENIIKQYLDLKLYLPINEIIIILIFSIIITMISGLIPSRVASSKNPVEALRTI